MRILIDDILRVRDSASGVPQLAAPQVAAFLQFLEGRADGVHTLLTDGGKSSGGINKSF